MNASADFYPGWKMTVRQHGLYFRLFAAACQSQHAATTEQKEALRRAAHQTAFGAPKSATVINRTREFDAIAAEFKHLANVLDDDQSIKRLIYAAQQRLDALERITSPTYTATLLNERFKVIPGIRLVSDLSSKQITQLIFTVNNRIRTLAAVSVPDDLLVRPSRPPVRSRSARRGCVKRATSAQRALRVEKRSQHG